MQLLKARLKIKRNRTCG